jgi:Protein of unknown function (DUF2510)
MSVMSGWYPDPAGSAELRFWDGQGWTAQTAPVAPAAPLAPAAPSAPSAPAEPTGPRVTYASTMAVRRPPGRSGTFYGLVAGGVAVLVAVAVAVPVALHKGHASIPVSALPTSIPKPPTTTVQLPPNAAGLVRIQGTRADELQQAADREWPFATTHVIGVYAEPDGQPKAYADIGNASLSAAGMHEYVLGFEKGFREDDPNVQFVQQDPGSFGGEMACSTSVLDGNPTEACVFADATAIGAILVEGPQSSSLPLAEQLREAAETRS